MLFFCRGNLDTLAAWVRAMRPSARTERDGETRMRSEGRDPASEHESTDAALQADLAGYQRERRRQRLGALAYLAIAALAMVYVAGCVAGSLVLLDLLENSTYLANLADPRRAALIVGQV